MIIWRGKGIFVVLIAFGGIAVGNSFLSLVGGLWPGLTPQSRVMFGMIIGLLVAAAGNFWFSRYLDDPSKHRKLVDPTTGQAYLFKDNSSLMFIPVRYWTYIMVIGAIAFLAAAIARMFV
jgi:hypothetical protein